MVYNVTTQQAGAWVKARMKTRKWSVKYVADRSGVSRQTIYAFMRGEHPPSEDTQRGLALALEVRADWYDRLLNDEEPVDLPAGDDLRKLRGDLARVSRRVTQLVRVVEAELGLDLASLLDDEESNATPDETGPDGVARPAP